MSEKEGVLTESIEKVDTSSREFLSVLQSKDAQIERLRESLQKQTVCTTIVNRTGETETGRV